MVINLPHQVVRLISHEDGCTERRAQVERESKRFVLACASFGVGESIVYLVEIELFHICSRGLNRVYVISIVYVLSRK